jgi:hypothetical protein
MGDVQFTPINMGGTKEIPPDAPEGAWLGAITLKKSATSKDKYPMLILETKLVEAFTDGNESAVGSSVSDFLTFFPRSARGYRMGVERLHELCAALNIEVPNIEEFNSWDDIRELTDALDGAQLRCWTRHEKDKRPDARPGSVRTVLSWTAPRGAAPAEAPAPEEGGGKRRRR